LESTEACLHISNLDSIQIEFVGTFRVSKGFWQDLKCVGFNSFFGFGGEGQTIFGEGDDSSNDNNFIELSAAQTISGHLEV